jgi:hypothetical protein
MKKTFVVIAGHVAHGEPNGRRRDLVAGDKFELDTVTDADTIAELIRRDFIEDPENPKKRTPLEKAAIEQRNIDAAEMLGIESAASREAARDEELRSTGRAPAATTAPAARGPK